MLVGESSWKAPVVAVSLDIAQQRPEFLDRAIPYPTGLTKRGLYLIDGCGEQVRFQSVQ